MVSVLNGKTAIVTGAASGIGLAAARALIEAGAVVVGLDRQAADVEFPILSCDLGDEVAIVSAVAEAAGSLGGLDIIVNNAGILEERALGSIDAGHVDRMFGINVRGTILVTREALPHIRDGGRIINIASELAYLGRAEASV